ncbi:MAG: flavodoxin [Anaerolineae bacterium]|nr:flavodoxin [Anaerolineae bacterium]
MAATIGLFYGSTSGNTEMAAEAIQQEFEKIQPGLVALHDIGSTDIDTLMNYEKLIIGVPTYNIGELQDDWYMVFDQLDSLSLAGCQVALFGMGDQYGYSDTFQDALGILGNKLRDIGAELIGFTSTEGYDFSSSLGVENDQFMGLALDEDHQASLTDQRIKAWVGQISHEFALPVY